MGMGSQAPAGAPGAVHRGEFVTIRMLCVYVLLCFELLHCFA